MLIIENENGIFKGLLIKFRRCMHVSNIKAYICAMIIRDDLSGYAPRGASIKVHSYALRISFKLIDINFQINI